MANAAGPGAGSANAPGTASARDLEPYTTHMLPSRPQMPPPIELRIEKILRQHTSQADSACRRHSSVIGLAPSLDELDEPGSASSPRHDFESKGIANSWKHNSKSEVGAWHADEGHEERQREQKDNRHWQTDGQAAEGWRRSAAWTSDWASGPFDGPGSASSRKREAVYDEGTQTRYALKADELAGLKHRFAVRRAAAALKHRFAMRSSRTWLADASRATIEQPCVGQATGDQQEHCACPNADGPGSASSRGHDSES